MGRVPQRPEWLKNVKVPGWLQPVRQKPAHDPEAPTGAEEEEGNKWRMGILEDKWTTEVPGSVILTARDSEPLGIRNTAARTSHSTIETGFTRKSPALIHEDRKKRTPDGKIILDPQPDDSANDPLNWPAWRRDLALFSLGIFSMVGGGMTPVLAAGFTNVAEDYHVEVSSVALTTGIYMAGMGIGSVLFSPTAILWGKRPVYLGGALLFIATSVWCALSPNYISLLLARFLQGVSVSPVECLPSASIAEIYFLHERAFRIGIYTLLLLGGKNLVPLVSAAIIQRYGWRWVFWIVAMVVGFCLLMLYLCVPETFWDRRPVPRKASDKPRQQSRFSKFFTPGGCWYRPKPPPAVHSELQPKYPDLIRHRNRINLLDAGFSRGFGHGNIYHAAEVAGLYDEEYWVPAPAATTVAPRGRTRTRWFSRVLGTDGTVSLSPPRERPDSQDPRGPQLRLRDTRSAPQIMLTPPDARTPIDIWPWVAREYHQTLSEPVTPTAHMPETENTADVQNKPETENNTGTEKAQETAGEKPESAAEATTSGKRVQFSAKPPVAIPPGPIVDTGPPIGPVPRAPPRRCGWNKTPLGEQRWVPPGISTSEAAYLERKKYFNLKPKEFEPYTDEMQRRPPLTFKERLRIFNGRLHRDAWHKVLVRPFILFCYPAMLWSAIVYSCSVGWLIVISESVAMIYRNSSSYNFTAMQTGLVYVSPFIGGILGTAVAGKVSDFIVMGMTRRNGGLYEPEFRLVMALPITVTTVIGLVGFGWSAQERDAWIVPTVFFGLVSFGCSLGSTTAITFSLDSYRMYAGEALVTLNFSKNVLHGLVWSLFVTQWLSADGSKTVFSWIGIIQLILLLSSIPMYIFGKRARMWTARKNIIESC
ncbi:MFS transporter [Diplogelasinospora grovesii]|uniref:MFS transporter n=1 Tax=Diplogelasinospora grovesii TaxID=303347 RepID=A0AAN6S831_9PEZI|nr:MFS transporter [Diplogelasinospora grovesii]